VLNLQGLHWDRSDSPGERGGGGVLDYVTANVSHTDRRTDGRTERRTDGQGGEIEGGGSVSVHRGGLLHDS